MKLLQAPDSFFIHTNGYTLGIGGAMPGISLSNNLVIGMACNHIIKLKSNPFQSGRPGMIYMKNTEPCFCHFPPF